MYVLLFLFVTSAGMPSSVTAEFKTELACEAAAKDLEKKMAFVARHSAWVCSSK